MSLNLQPTAAADFKAACSQSGDSITVTMLGTADIPARAALDSLLTQLHSESTRLGVKQVVVDLAQLEFMNSSCFKSFVSWIEQVQNLDSPSQYRIQFVSNPDMHWQRRSLKALSCFAAEIITVS